MSHYTVTMFLIKLYLYIFHQNKQNKKMVKLLEIQTRNLFIVKLRFPLPLPELICDGVGDIDGITSFTIVAVTAVDFFGNSDGAIDEICFSVPVAVGDDVAIDVDNAFCA